MHTHFSQSFLTRLAATHQAIHFDHIRPQFCERCLGVRLADAAARRGACFVWDTAKIKLVASAVYPDPDGEYVLVRDPCAMHLREVASGVDFALLAIHTPPSAAEASYFLDTKISVEWISFIMILLVHH
jgi:hypothetical protein